MAEPHQPLAGGELALGPGIDVAARLGLVEQVEGRARRAAMQRPGKGAIGAERGRDQRGAARRDDPRGKGRGVEPVVDDARRNRCRAPRPATGATGAPWTMRSRSSAVPRAGSGAAAPRPGAARSSAAIATGRVARISAGVAVFRQARQGEPHALDQRPACRACVEPVAEPGKGGLTAGAETARASSRGQPVAGEAFPQQPDRALIAVIGGELGERVAAHPQDAARRRRCGSAPSRRRPARRGRYPPVLSRRPPIRRRAARLSSRSIPEAAIACRSRAISAPAT